VLRHRADQTFTGWRLAPTIEQRSWCVLSRNYQIVSGLFIDRDGDAMLAESVS
jgi:hypothetical protein